MATSEGVLGIRERFITATESVYGTGVSLASAVIPGYNLTVTPNFTQGFQEIKGAGTDVRTINSRVAGPLGLQYTLNYTPSNWRMLKYVFSISSETGSNPYTHTLAVGNTLSSYTCEWAMRHDSDPIIFKMTGNVIRQFKINWKKAAGEGTEGFITCTADCIAQNYTNPSLQSGSFSVTGDPFQYRHSTLTLNTSDVVEINSGELMFDQGITPNDSRYASSTNGRTIASPIATLFRISGRVNINVLSSDYVTLWATAAAISGTNTIVFSQSASNKITFTLTNVYCEPVPLGGTNLDGVNTGDFVFTATGVAVVGIDAIANW